MPRIGAPHHSLGQIDTGPGEIPPVVDILNLMNRSAVDSHTERNFRVALQRLTYFQRTADWSFGFIEETSAIPSPDGRRINLSAASAPRN